MKRKGCLFFVILLIALCVAAYATNPDEAKHQVAARMKVEKIADNLLAKYGVNKGIFGQLGFDLSEKFVDDMMKNYVSADNYYLFSVTKIHWENREYPVGVGAFNKVYISNKVDEIAQKAIEDYVKEKINDFIPGIENIFK